VSEKECGRKLYQEGTLACRVCVYVCVEKSGTNGSFGHDSDALATMVP
jgi:hypothetical protein